LIATALDLDAEPLLALQTRYDMITTKRDRSFLRRLSAVRKIASVL
jgi:plasmid maintenance system antidote protein VapI